MFELYFHLENQKGEKEKRRHLSHSSSINMKIAFHFTIILMKIIKNATNVENYVVAFTKELLLLEPLKKIDDDFAGNSQR